MKKPKYTVIFLSALLWLVCACAVDYENPNLKGEVTLDAHSYKIIAIDGNYGQTFVHDPNCLLGDISYLLFIFFLVLGLSVILFRVGLKKFENYKKTSR